MFGVPPGLPCSAPGPAFPWSASGPCSASGPAFPCSASGNSSSSSSNSSSNRKRGPLTLIR
eukprot:13328198-Alexandrium_andersonii.AAC.1